MLAIIAPKAKREKSVLIVVLAAVALSCLFYYIPVLKNESGGFSIIVCAVCAALLGAALFPMHEDTAAEEKEVRQA